jgi:poly(glycerol-phosphate) alpha-glucosyltransferase
MWLATAGDSQVAINAGTRMLDVYEYFQKSYAEGLDNIAVYSRPDDGTRYVEITENLFEVFDGDVLVRKEYYHGNAGSLRMVSFYDSGKRIKDMIYDDWGYLNKIRKFDPESGAVKEEKYYTTSGELCMEAFHKPGDTEDEGTLEKLIVYDSQGNIEGEFSDNAELVALCLKQIMSNEKFYLFTVEDGNMAKAITMLGKTEKNMALCEIVHTIFLNDAYNPASRPQRFYKYLCENHKKYDGIIMLTEDSRRDFQKLYGDSCNIFVIPHPYPYEINRIDFNERDHKKAVIVSRLNITKLINMSIDVFSLVVKEVPDAKLEIYGRGDEEEKLREQIIRLRLEKNVFLMGYTDDPLAIFKTAALSMMTSLAEGYGMTLMESICNGCPAFAFDIKYGPSEIIQDGRTGFLVERFNIDLFARKVIKFFKDEQMQRDMSSYCYEDVSRFNTDSFLENWFNMTKTLYDRYLKAKAGVNSDG